LRNFTQFTIPYCIPGLVQFAEFETQLRTTKWNGTEPLIDPHDSTNAWVNDAHAFARLTESIALDPGRKDER
jgi:hypothetical protein